METRPNIIALLASIWRGRGDLRAPGVARALLGELWEAWGIWWRWGDGQAHD